MQPRLSTNNKQNNSTQRVSSEQKSPDILGVDELPIEDSRDLLAVFDAIDKLADDSASFDLQNNVLTKLRALAGAQITSYLSSLCFGGISTNSYPNPQTPRQ